MMIMIRRWFEDEIVVWRVIAAALIATVMGGAWDVWWHTMVGRETFFEPPHLMIYGGIIFAVVAGFGAWWYRRERLWRRIAFALVAIPLIVAPFDEVWHRLFGFEDLTSVWIIWSPPHVALDLALVYVLVLLLPFLPREKPEIRTFLGAGIFATLITLLTFLVIPLDPEGQFHLIGWWGAAGSAFVITLIMQYGARVLGGLIPALSIAVFSSVFIALDAEIGVRSTDIIMRPHFEFPTWLLVFSTFAIGVVLDVCASTSPWLRGAIGGFAWAAVLYGAGVFFIPPEFSYGVREIGITVCAGGVGGLIAGIVAMRVSMHREQRT